MKCHIERYNDGQWQHAATFEPDPQTLDRGIEGGCRLEYDHDYVIANIGNQKAEIIPGLPVGFELHRYEAWPPFLIDLMPSGAGRRAWLKRMQVENDGPQVEWHLLVKGAGCPPGNLRISDAVLDPPPEQFKIGFPRNDIIEQQEDFIEYAEERGAYVAGAGSIQGEAPKYLVVEDHKGMFHAEGALPDDMIKKFWLVKFPRGRRTEQRNQEVLRNEAPYLEVARRFGVRVGAPLVYEGGALFIPRFDREVIDGHVSRLGMHSLYAIARVPGYGASVRHETYCRAIVNTTCEPTREIREYILRDILNLALRNTDNHGRNTAVLRVGDQVALSPLFDFAPMFLDPEGIGRVSRWEDERPGSQPEWATICEKLKDVLDPTETREWLADLADQVSELPDTMQKCHVDDDIIQKLAQRIEAVGRGLQEAKPTAIA